MRILVTGAAGFLGQHLCRRLEIEGHVVQRLDIKLGQDVRDKHDYLVDRIYHLACHASPKVYQKNPIDTLWCNVVGSRRILDLALRNNARVLLASTSEVYGDPEVSPQSEDYRGNVNPIGIRACYDEGKRAAECLFYDYQRQYDTDIRVARIFNTYGPGMALDDGRMIPNFVTQALRNEPITVYGDGSQTRSLCYVDNMIDGLIRLMESDFTEPVNLGNPDEMTVLGIAREVTRLASPGLAMKFEDLPEDDPQRRCPDITRAKRVLNWFPEISLEVGLRHTIEDFRRRMAQAA